MIEAIERIQRAIELESDPMKRANMTAVLRQTLNRLDEMHRHYFGEGERRG